MPPIVYPHKKEPAYVRIADATQQSQKPVSKTAAKAMLKMPEAPPSKAKAEPVGKLTDAQLKDAKKALRDSENADFGKTFARLGNHPQIRKLAFQTLADRGVPFSEVVLKADPISRRTLMNDWAPKLTDDQQVQLAKELLKNRSGSPEALTGIKPMLEFAAATLPGHKPNAALFQRLTNVLIDNGFTMADIEKRFYEPGELAFVRAAANENAYMARIRDAAAMGMGETAMINEAWRHMDSQGKLLLADLLLDFDNQMERDVKPHAELANTLAGPAIHAARIFKGIRGAGRPDESYVILEMQTMKAEVLQSADFLEAMVGNAKRSTDFKESVRDAYIQLRPPVTGGNTNEMRASLKAVLEELNMPVPE